MDGVLRWQQTKPTYPSVAEETVLLESSHKESESLSSSFFFNFIKVMSFHFGSSQDWVFWVWFISGVLGLKNWGQRFKANFVDLIV